jgi:hypothetical protein
MGRLQRAPIRRWRQDGLEGLVPRYQGGRGTQCSAGNFLADERFAQRPSPSGCVGVLDHHPTGTSATIAGRLQHPPELAGPQHAPSRVRLISALSTRPGLLSRSYPWQHQFGWGFDGSHRRDSSGRDQQLGATYIWNNAKTVGGPEVNDFVITNHADACSPPTHQLETNYMQQNREYYLGIAKPSYTKYQYPHPLAQVARVNIHPAQR